MKKKLVEAFGLQKSHKNMENVILIFSKVPHPGLVKTRLSNTSCLTELDVAKIAEAMLKDTIVLSSETLADRIDIGFFPPESQFKLKKIVSTIKLKKKINDNILLNEQIGSNFDERFSSAVRTSLKRNTENLVILGADLPYLDHNIINDAFKFLTNNKSKDIIVLGPATEGGIYLVGIKDSFNPDLFSNLQLFSGGIEIFQFIKICKEMNFNLILLPPLNDIDVEEDLVSLIAFIEALTSSNLYKGFHFPTYTSRIINELGLYIVEKSGETRKRRIAKR